MSLLGRVAPPLAGLAAALALLIQTRGLDDLAREGQLGPGVWPRLALGGLALACAARLASSGAGGAPRPAADPDRPPLAAGRVAAAVGVIVLYVLAVPVLGFALATLGFLAAFMPVAGARAAATVAGAAVGGTGLLLYLFVRLVYLPLPKGWGPFEAATIALYRALGLF